MTESDISRSNLLIERNRPMLKRIALMVLMVLLAAMPAFAQKAEVGVTFGWVFSDGVSGNALNIPVGCPSPAVGSCIGTFNRLDPKDSFGWGIDVGVFVGPNAEVGFLYNNQPSTLQAGGTTTLDIGNMKINTYHGYFAYNWGAGDAKFRPYILGGFGATSFGEVSYTGARGAGTLPGVSRFSSTWGGGVKVYGSSNVGGRFGVRWTPTYIKSDAAGWWCDPYWGCYLVGNAQYANQLELNGGITFRF
jgi:hypothetical protein